jgi:hypothetical protein
MGNENMKPTNKLRWVHLHMGELKDFHPSSIQIGDTNYCQVLQQWWENGNDAGEWRDVPVHTHLVDEYQS